MIVKIQDDRLIELYMDNDYRKAKDFRSFIYLVAQRAEYQCRVRWHEDTLVVWDNRFVLHRGIHDFRHERRHLIRIDRDGRAPALALADDLAIPFGLARAVDLCAGVSQPDLGLQLHGPLHPRVGAAVHQGRDAPDRYGPRAGLWGPPSPCSTPSSAFPWRGWPTSATADGSSPSVSLFGA